VDKVSLLELSDLFLDIRSLYGEDYRLGGDLWRAVSVYHLYHQARTSDFTDKGLSDLCDFWDFSSLILLEADIGRCFWNIL
jgi:hypothetical protein